MRSYKFLLFVMMLAVMGLVLPSCNDDSPFRSSGPADIHIQFVTPHNGDSVTGVETVKVKITGLTMDCAGMGGANVDGHGHWELYLDGSLIGESCGETVSADFTGVATGKHALVASLRENDHDPYHQHNAGDPFEQSDTDAIISVNVD